MFSQQLTVTAAVHFVHPTLKWNCIKKLRLKNSVPYHNLQPCKTLFLILRCVIHVVLGQ
jgi:hypothetical protein